jgi:hypothetical protein
MVTELYFFPAVAIYYNAKHNLRTGINEGADLQLINNGLECSSMGMQPVSTIPRNFLVRQIKRTKILY